MLRRGSLRGIRRFLSPVSRWCSLKDRLSLGGRSPRLSAYSFLLSNALHLNFFFHRRLAQFELSTSSKSTAVLPGSIYLSHQFTFYSFDEDYHALIRRLHFDIPGTNLDVRKEVEARPFSSVRGGGGESFVSGASSPHDAQSSRPFDEPLTFAMVSGLDYTSSSPPVISMLPNGIRPGSFKASIPIQSVASGISEGVN